MNARQTMQQQRAAFAQEQVARKMATLGESGRREFLATVNGAPALVVMSGLGPAMAFLLARKNSHGKDLCQMLGNWLSGEHQPLRGHKDIMDGITKVDMHHYRLAQVETLAVLAWIKRFARASAVASKAVDGAGS